MAEMRWLIPDAISNPEPFLHPTTVASFKMKVLQTVPRPKFLQTSAARYV
jgi:hypothetical protein